MKKYQGIIILGCVAGLFDGRLALHAEEKVCPRCEQIREYNKTHHKNYQYYDEYIKDEQKENLEESKNVEKVTAPKNLA